MGRYNSHITVIVEKYGLTRIIDVFSKLSAENCQMSIDFNGINIFKKMRGRFPIVIQAKVVC